MKNIMLLPFLLMAACFLAMSCKHESVFELMPASHTGIVFENTITENDSFNVLRFEYIYNGGGVAIGDVNNDGLTDIFFSGNMVSSVLYLNRGNFKFEDITLPALVSTNVWATGVSMVDINQDGLLDIYLCTIHPDAAQSTENILFVNQGINEKGIPEFKECAQEVGLADKGYSTHAAFFDYDLDGDLDVYLLTNALENFNRNTLRVPSNNGLGKSTDRLYRNDGIREKGLPVFTNVSTEAGILAEGWGLGVAILDINQDGWPDIYAANDFLSNDLLWINNQDGTFTNKITDYFHHTSHNSMGIDAGDINNDGLTDIAVMDMMPEHNKRQKTMFMAPNYDRYQMNIQMGYQPQYIRNMLQVNNGSITYGEKKKSIKFSEVGQLAGMHATDWSWSALFADFDNDGFKDLFITNGYHKDITDLDYVMYRKEANQFGTPVSRRKAAVEEMKKLKGVKLANYLYQNNGDLNFVNKAKEWGLDQPSYANGAAYADLDNDGDLDLVVNNINDKASLYQNRSISKSNAKSKHYIRLTLKGDSLNQQGIGAKITIAYGKRRQYHEHYIQRGYLSTVENIIHFGLGSALQADTLTVVWPDGKTQVFVNVKADQLVTIAHTEATLPVNVSRNTSTLLKEVSAERSLFFKHEETEFIDFKIQALLPHRFSQEGPGLAVADINQDGREDFYIGNSAQKPGALYLQDENGKFRYIKFPVEKDRQEDMGSLFFDADNDNDLDLYVVSGSSEYNTHDQALQDRFYRCDGIDKSGIPIFYLDTLALPRTRASGSCVAAADYDKDGDLDLFVGGRIERGKYPLPAESYLLQNKSKLNNIVFTDDTKSVAPALKNIGLITSALWTDVDNDGWTDLLLTGEWMPLTYFHNQQGKLVNETETVGLTETHGWWTSLTAGDFDTDGDTDYIAGNIGLNTRYKASITEPVFIYAKDYDKNGSIDPVLCAYIPDESGKKNLVPVHARDLLSDQIPMIKKRYLHFATYGAASLHDIFSAKEMEDVQIFKSECFETSYFENVQTREGTRKLIRKTLPVQVQFAPAYGMVTNDFNYDGNLDVLVAGNSYSTDVHVGMHDASVGVLLMGDGKGGFTYLPPSQSGFMVDTDAKAMAKLYTADSTPMILVSSNADSLKAFVSTPLTNKRQSQLVTVESQDAYAVITLRNGKQRRHELYYGSSYLSHSSRSFEVPAHVKDLKIYDYAGRLRNIQKK